jgi:hypothetical protein
MSVENGLSHDGMKKDAKRCGQKIDLKKIFEATKKNL